jgi:trans-aconitate methyltransferase
MFDSKKYWQERYVKGGNSGAGSYGEFASYKANVINNFVRDNNVETVLELGCGDGNQLALFDIPVYVGQDVSEKCVEQNKIKFPQYTFINYLDGVGGFDLTMSLDVVFHLIEDVVYKQYIYDLFSLSDRFVIIYAPNENKNIANHVKYRKFTDDMPRDFRLLKKITNPLKCEYTQSDFYIFERI